MPTLQKLAALVAASAALCAATPALAAPVTVNLRIEGATQTLYDGPITTDARTISTASSNGAHVCDGTNNGANTTSGGTPTTAAYDAAQQLGLAFDAQYSYGDFFITQIGSDVMPASYDPSWSWWNNFQSGSVGGCQYLLQPGDNILWSFNNYGDGALSLSGVPATAATGESFTAHVDQYVPHYDSTTNTTVTDKSAASGASVGGATTDTSGNATVSFASPGTYTLKATRSDAVRSNAETVCVYTPGSGDCGTAKAPAPTQTAPAPPTPAPAPAPPAKDLTPPTVTLSSVQNGKTYRVGPRVLSGSASDAGGIYQVFLRLRSSDGGNLTSASRCRWFSSKRGVFTHRTVPCSRARFFRIGSSPNFSYLLPSRLGHGKYVLDVKVLDKSYNAGRATATFKVR